MQKGSLFLILLCFPCVNLPSFGIRLAQLLYYHYIFSHIFMCLFLKSKLHGEKAHDREMG